MKKYLLYMYPIFNL